MGIWKQNLILPTLEIDGSESLDFTFKGDIE